MAAARKPARPRRPVHGVLLLDKPLGLTSNQALQKAKWLLRAQKAGHTGTLDPLATGVLPLCFGAATKFSSLHLEADKTYVATVQLGAATRTGDAEGEVVARQPVPLLDAARLRAVQQQFTGAQTQIPPMYSALKKDGRPLHEYARAGVHVERKPRQIVIHELELARAADAPDALQLRVRCSKGTYIRTLGEDIAAALGTCGHLVQLRRAASGAFDAAQCIRLPALEALGETARLQPLLPVHALLAGHMDIVLNNDDAGRFLTGQRRRGPWPDVEHVAVWGERPRALLGVARVKAGELIPVRLLSPLEIKQILENQAPDSAPPTQTS